MNRAIRQQLLLERMQQILVSIEVVIIEKFVGYRLC